MAVGGSLHIHTTTSSKKNSSRVARRRKNKLLTRKDLNEPHIPVCGIPQNLVCLRIDASESILVYFDKQLLREL